MSDGSLTNKKNRCSSSGSSGRRLPMELYDTGYGFIDLATTNQIETVSDSELYELLEDS